MNVCLSVALAGLYRCSTVQHVRAAVLIDPISRDSPGQMMTTHDVDDARREPKEYNKFIPPSVRVPLHTHWAAPAPRKLCSNSNGATCNTHNAQIRWQEARATCRPASAICFPTNGHSADDGRCYRNYSMRATCACSCTANCHHVPTEILDGAYQCGIAAINLRAGHLVEAILPGDLHGIVAQRLHACRAHVFRHVLVPQRALARPLVDA